MSCKQGVAGSTALTWDPAACRGAGAWERPGGAGGSRQGSRPAGALGPGQLCLQLVVGESWQGVRGGSCPSLEFLQGKSPGEEASFPVRPTGLLFDRVGVMPSCLPFRRWVQLGAKPPPETEQAACGMWGLQPGSPFAFFPSTRQDATCGSGAASSLLSRVSCVCSVASLHS